MTVGRASERNSEPAPARRSATAVVLTTQSTTSSSFTDLATVGPSVTLFTGTKALVMFTVTYNNATAGNNSITSYAVSGASTIAASTNTGLLGINAALNNLTSTFVQLLTGLTAGSNTFTLKYLSPSSTTATFNNRYLTVIDMGSS